MAGAATRIFIAVWAHLKRAYRMRFNMFSWAISDVLWLLIFIYAVLAFTDPGSYGTVVPVVYWSLVAWSLMSTPVWAIGNWVKSYVNLGLIDYNELSGMSHKVFMAMRALPSLCISLIAALAAAAFLYASTGVVPFKALNPLLLAAALASILAIATLYSLSISWAGLRLSVPAPLLDVMNRALFIGGGVAVDVEAIPWPLRLIAIATPYSHPAEIMRYAVAGNEPYLGLVGEALATLFFIALLYLAQEALYRSAMKKYQTTGVKGVGVT